MKMKKRLLFVFLVVTLVLTLSAPTAALAAKPKAFYAGGDITSITPGDVFPAGNSGRWVVAEREITGNLYGDINGVYSLVYKANIESVYTQAGNIHGRLVVDGIELNVQGKIQPLEFVPPYGLPLLTISGKWTFVNGGQGNGDFVAYAMFIPDAEGHVAMIMASGIQLTGKWK